MGVPFRAIDSGEHGNHREDREDHQEPQVRRSPAQPLRACGRPRAYLRKFALCRICFRELALRGDVAGVVKSSW